jgi:hypothetical protein
MMLNSHLYRAILTFSFVVISYEIVYNLTSSSGSTH